ncbi:XapX domain-containing protein [Paraburkholderia sp. BL6669N2]|uniref:DUF1427 family protein n=1 Tax=Paraburkholderia sp. BL6669N2 TaxID=1938807 RepID=UPI000E27CC7C|nr:DUF1427 family protein [Paraburkholderia sp. BL6669N2]REG51403.1 XapX domain-containing protein [Paraburkholderia sp. BL6669N2]
MWQPASHLDTTVTKAHLISLPAGVLFGRLYSVMDAKSPAPPTVARVGLRGMPGGEHMIPLVRTRPASSMH